MKRLISLLILALCFMAMLPLSSQAATDTWDGSADTDWLYADTSATSYTITTAKQLAGLAQLVNEGTFDFEGRTINLAANIDLGATPWTPIGYGGGELVFKGTFEGGGHSITGLYISDDSGNAVGLFGQTVGGTIKNISVDGIVTGRGNTGGIVGTANGDIVNCHSSVTVHSNGTSTNVGGVAGSFGSDQGGLGEYVMINCSSTGNVSSSARDSTVGGLVGALSRDIIVNCYNSGNVSATNNSTTVGGVVGQNVEGEIKFCYSIGEYSGEGNVGGVVGTNGTNDVGAQISTVMQSYYLEGKGSRPLAGTSLPGSEFGHVGFFTSQDSEITLYDHYGNEGITTANLFDALSESQAAYNAETIDFKAQDMWMRDGVNSGYPVHATYWKDYAVAPQNGKIGTAEELAWLINNPNARGTYTLSNPIDLSAHIWEPIGTNDNAFWGTFDGAGHDITGLYIYAPESSYQGLFGNVGSGDEVKNVGVSGSVTGQDNVGGVVGYASNATVLNCNYSGDVLATDIGADVGGVVGYAYGTTIQNCTNSGTVSATGNSAYVGGVVGGNNNSSTVQNSYNSGTVSATGGSANVGGVAGCNDNSSTVQNSYNSGTVSATGSAVSVGGVAGRNDESSTVQNSYNSGTVSATGSAVDVGGVAGRNGAQSTVLNSYNIGEIIATDGSIGGVVGSNYGINSDSASIVRNSYYLTGKGADVSVGSNENSTITNVGSFSSNSSEIKIDSGITADDAILKNDLAIALNAGSAAYNGTSPAVSAMSWMPKSEQNNGYPVLDAGWGEFATTSAPQNGNIGTAEELAWLINNPTAGGTYTLTKNIDLSAHMWEAIGVLDAPFSGTFDGAGHKITGLYINAPTTKDQGLFGTLSDDITVKNVHVDGTITGDSSVGGVVGQVFVATVSNCHSTGTVIALNETSSVGGVAGMVTSASVINDCSSSATVTGGNYVGGVVGFNNEGTIANCSSSAIVTGESFVGGVVGFNDEGTIANCSSSTTVMGESYVGGVVGASRGAVTLTNNYFIGEITGNNQVGGVVGSSDSTIQNSYYLSGGRAESGVGFVGENATITNVGSFSSNSLVITIDSGVTVTDTIPKTDLTAALNAGATAYNTANPSATQASFWMSKKDQNSGYPVYATYWVDNAVAPTEGQITSAAELAWLINNSTVGGTYTITQNIDLSEHMWTPISNFDGTLDGGDNTIEGMTVYTPSKGNRGLIGSVWSSGTVRDILIYGSVTGSKYVGGVVGQNEGIIENCVSYVTVTGHDNVGGVVGYNTGTVTGSANMSDIVSTTHDTGILLGGVVGYNLGSVTDCYNTGNITVTGDSANVGGVVGYIGIANQKSTVTDCYNEGNVLALGGNTKVGGIVGYSYGTVQNNYNVATISVTGARCSVGGVVGRNYENVINNYNSGEVSSPVDISTNHVGGIVGENDTNTTVTNNYSVGKVSASNFDHYVGGVVGINSGSVTNSYYLTGKGASKAVGTNNGTVKNLGSFSSTTSPITIYSGVTEDANIPTTDLLSALNAGAKAYNATVTDGQEAYRWEKVSHSSYPTHTTEGALGDTNGDWNIDVDDLRAIAGDKYNTATTPENENLDLNGDGKINFVDLAIARNSKNFGK